MITNTYTIRDTKTVIFATWEARDAFFSTLPKSLKAKSTNVGERQEDGTLQTVPAVEIRVMLSNGITGEANESGDKRLAKFNAAIAAF